MSVLAQAEGLDDIAVPTAFDTLQLNRSIFNNPLEQIHEGNVPSYGLLTQDSLREYFGLKAAVWYIHRGLTLSRTLKFSA